MKRIAGRARPRQGTIILAMLVLLMMVGLLVTGLTLTVGRDQDLTMRRIETVQAFYAAEAGVNMAMRELALGVDEDGDGGIGSIADGFVTSDSSQLNRTSVRVERYDGEEISFLSSQAWADESCRRFILYLLPAEEEEGDGIVLRRWSEAVPQSPME